MKRIVLLLLLLFFPPSIFAQEPFKIVLHASTPLSRGNAQLVRPDGSKSLRRTVEFRSEGAGVWIAHVFLDPDDYAEGGFLSVVALQEDGKLVLSRVYEVRNKQLHELRGVTCVREADLYTKSDFHQMSAEELAVFERVKREQYRKFQLQLQALLTPQVKYAFQREERVAGLFGPPLSAEMPIEEIVWRLQRLESVTGGRRIAE